MGAMKAADILGASTGNDDSAELDLEMKERCSNHFEGVQQPAEEDRLFPLDDVAGTYLRRADGLVGRVGIPAGIGAAMVRRADRDALGAYAARGMGIAQEGRRRVLSGGNGIAKATGGGGGSGGE